MSYLRIGAMLFSMMLAGFQPAAAQSAAKIGTPDQAGDAGPAGANYPVPKTCKGKIEGRWRLTCATIPTGGTVRVVSGGRVLAENRPENMIASILFGSQPTIGGRLFRHDPVQESGTLNRCWVSGTIRLGRGKVQGKVHKITLKNVFIAKGARLAVGEFFIDGNWSACTLTGY